MVAEGGDDHLRQQLEGLRAAHFEQLVNERAKDLAQRETQEQDVASTERAIINSARVLRDKIIDVQAKHLKRHQATWLGRWLMTRRSIPEIRFGFAQDDGFGWDAGDMTVATAPLMKTEDDTVDGKVAYGWVFELESPVPEAMAWSGKEPPIHAWGSYGRSSIEIYRVAEDEATGLQSKDKWFTVNPDTDHIHCWKLAEQRRGFFNAPYNEPNLEEDQRVIPHFAQDSGQVAIGFGTSSQEAEEPERQRSQRFSERSRELYAPDLETGLQLLGIIRGSTNELS